MIEEMLILKFIDFGFTAAQIGFERQAIQDRAAERIQAGDTPEQVAEFLVKMRDEAIAKAEEAAK